MWQTASLLLPFSKQCLEVWKAQLPILQISSMFSESGKYRLPVFTFYVNCTWLIFPKTVIMPLICSWRLWWEAVSVVDWLSQADSQSLHWQQQQQQWWWWRVLDKGKQYQAAASSEMLAAAAHASCCVHPPTPLGEVPPPSSKQLFCILWEKPKERKNV